MLLKVKRAGMTLVCSFLCYIIQADHKLSDHLTLPFTSTIDHCEVQMNCATITLIMSIRQFDALTGSALQFGQSFTTCFKILKGTLAYYTSNNATAYRVLLHASKTFDRVHSGNLFDTALNK
jgi:hypothetical protein